MIIPIINSVTSVNLKKAGMASQNIAIKSDTCCCHQFCSSLWTSRFCVHAYYHAKTATTRASQEWKEWKDNGKISETFFDKVPLTKNSPHTLTLQHGG